MTQIIRSVKNSHIEILQIFDPNLRHYHIRLSIRFYTISIYYINIKYYGQCDTSA
jgi:hypothetical protein